MREQVTLRTLLLTANGLYREVGGAGWLRGDLIAHLPEVALAQPISLHRVGVCIYAIHLHGDPGPAYELLSRRRRTRE